MVEKNRAGKYSLQENRWRSVSDEGKYLVTRMMEFDPACRLSCAEILSSPFVSNAPSTFEQPHMHVVEVVSGSSFPSSLGDQALTLPESFADVISTFLLSSSTDLESADQQQQSVGHDDASCSNDSTLHTAAEDVRMFMTSLFSTHGTTY
jgi:serine/threonine protein kinase